MGFFLVKNAFKGQNLYSSECVDIFLNFAFHVTCNNLRQGMMKCQEYPPYVMSQRGGVGIRFVLLGDTLILTQLFKVTLNDT